MSLRDKACLVLLIVLIGIVFVVNLGLDIDELATRISPGAFTWSALVTRSDLVQLSFLN